MLSKLTIEDLNKPKAVSPLQPEMRDAETDEHENTYSFDVADIHDRLTDTEIELLFPYQALYNADWFTDAKKEEAYKTIKALFIKLHLHLLKSYTYIKGRKAMLYAATPDYPIFLIDEGKYKIIYQPLQTEPEYRYICCGDIPKAYLHGLKQLENETDRRKKRKEENRLIREANPDAEVDESGLEDIQEVILVPEPAAAFGIALMGYYPCYLTGSQPVFSDFLFNKLRKLSKKVYQVWHNTEEDKRLAHVIALEHLELYNIELPVTVKVKTEYAQQQFKKIVTLNDYLQWQNKYEFGETLKQALPYLFWDKEPVYSGPKEKRVRVGWKYDFKSTQSYNFLNKMGFYRLPIEGRKTDYIYIYKDGNIIRERTPNKVKNFIHDFLKERRLDVELRDTMYESTRLSEASLSNLDETAIDFSDCDENTQFLFFENCTLEVTANRMATHGPGELRDRYVWEKDVIKHEYFTAEPPFQITLSPAGVYDIEVLHHDCMFFNFMIQTSRIHWRQELEVNLKDKSREEQEAYRLKHKFDIAGENLTNDERFEQKQHLINKIFALGYILHQHKSRSKTWAVVGTDDKISHDQKSHGGSGKSMLFNQALSYIYSKPSIHKIPGTNPSITQNPHIFHGLDKDKKVLIIDDADKYLNFRFFFEFITSDQVVNNKNGDIFSISFNELCKMVWLTNFSFTTDPSTERRILYFVTSDYYHPKSDSNDYKENREPKDDFGKELFTQFTPEEFNRFYNTAAYCLQFFLQCPIKFGPPMSSVTKRKLQREMGVEFESWASLYFHESGYNINRYIVKAEAMQEFKRSMPSKYEISSTQFKRAVEAYCKFNGFVFNPEELINDSKDHRIVHNVLDRTLNRNGDWDRAEKKKSHELFYIQTVFDQPLNKVIPGEEPFSFNK